MNCFRLSALPLARCGTVRASLSSTARLQYLSCLSSCRSKCGITPHKGNVSLSCSAALCNQIRDVGPRSFVRRLSASHIPTRAPATAGFATSSLSTEVTNAAAGASGTPYSTSTNLTAIQDMETYEQHVYSSERLVVAYFYAKFSTEAYQVILPHFRQLAQQYSQYTFLTVDVDSCPRAAYHAEVDDVPTVVLMQGDDAFKVRITPEQRSNSSTLIARTKAAIDNARDIKNFRSTSAWYSHNIPIDNLNVKRVGWPTS
eukprot:GHVT01064202.1.p1 GENE.GHVT01064202.1~~GHVT01064202.1.p1  ORF type:complete len:258 (+),score=12.98 GHVT01064202.1:189-962(+)